jgi:hypothetical protein
MMLPAREIPEEDPRRTGLEGAAGTPAEAPADLGRGTDAGKAPQPDTDGQVGGAAQPDTRVSADNGVQANNGIPDDNPDDNAVPTDNGVQAGKAAQADAGVVAGGDSVHAAAGREWSEVLAMFVDDPRGSVTEASAIVDEAINTFIAAARGRQASLAASWQARDSDTEQLRMALQDYRTFWTSMTQLPQSA